MPIKSVEQQSALMLHRTRDLLIRQRTQMTTHFVPIWPSSGWYIDDSVEWTVRGDNALTGTYNGKQAVGELWAQFGSKDFRTEPHDFIADGDKVVVLTSIHLEGETVESADILTYNGDGKLVAFDTRADAQVVDRVFAK